VLAPWQGVTAVVALGGESSTTSSSSPVVTPGDRTGSRLAGAVALEGVRAGLVGHARDSVAGGPVMLAVGRVILASATGDLAVESTRGGPVAWIGATGGTPAASSSSVSYARIIAILIRLHRTRRQ